jgi:hypothetical protein
VVPAAAAADARLAVNYLDQDKDGGSVFCHFPLPFFLFVVSIRHRHLTSLSL